MPDQTEMRVMRLKLTYRVPTLNVLLRRHWSERGRDKKRIGAEIAALLCGKRPIVPIEYAHVHILRYSSHHEGPDMDGLLGGCKDLIDCLTTPFQSKPNKRGFRKTINPYGMGLIRDDNRLRVRVTVEHVRVPASDFKSGCEVTITELPSSPAP